MARKLQCSRLLLVIIVMSVRDLGACIAHTVIMPLSHTVTLSISDKGAVTTQQHP